MHLKTVQNVRVKHMDFKKFKEKLQKIIDIFSESEDCDYVVEEENEEDDYWNTIMKEKYNIDPEEVPF